ncbi:MAG: lycopene cyclase domain-containing protein [Micrococcales bacterium]
MPGLYLTLLLLSIVGLGLIDQRNRLAFFLDAKRSALTLAVSVAFFLLWDVSGIGLGIFFEGENQLLVGLYLAKDLPLEEVFFLTVLCYSALITYQLLNLRKWPLGGRQSRIRGRKNK